MEYQKRKSQPKPTRQSQQLRRLQRDHAPQFLSLLAFLCHAPKAHQDTMMPYVVHVGLSIFKTHEIIAKICKAMTPKTKGFSAFLTEEWNTQFDTILTLFTLEEFFQIVIKDKLVLSFPAFMDRKTAPSVPAALKTLKIPEIAHPEYYLTELIAKYQGEHDIGEHFDPEESVESVFYNQPRFITKISELEHFRHNGLHKGEIALLEYSGNSISGNHVYVVTKESYLEVHQKTSNIYPIPFAHQFSEIKRMRPPPLNQEDSSQSDESFSSDKESRSTKDPLKTFDLKLSFRFIGHSGKITCASLSQDELYVVTGSVDRTVKLWCLRLNVLLSTYKCHTRTVWDVHFNPSGLYLLSGGADGIMALWKTDSCKPQRLFIHQRDVFKVQFAKNPDYVISAGEDGILTIYNILDSTAIISLQVDHPITNFHLSRSGVLIVLMESDGRVTLHDVQKGTLVGSFYFYFKGSEDSTQKRQKIHEVCLSENEKDLVCLTSKHILYYSTTALKEASTISMRKQKGTPEKAVCPYMVFMSFNNLRFNFCTFAQHNLLMIGSTKYGL